MATRKADVQALLKRCDGDLQKIERLYKKSLHNQRVSTDLQVDIKNFCENLRSILDYIAHDIRETHCPAANPKARFYFPILPTRAEFEAQANSWYPDLGINAPDLWKYLESIQPYHDASRWLGHLNRVNNENKHGQLVEQTRIETEQVRASSPGGTVSWTPKNVRFGSGVTIGGVPVNPSTQLPVPHPSQKIDKIIWVDFRFSGENVSALRLLKDALKGVEGVADRVDRLL